MGSPSPMAPRRGRPSIADRPLDPLGACSGVQREHKASRLSGNLAQPRSRKYVGELMRVADFADRNGFAGILLFEGNDVFVAPWAMAQHIIANTARSSPLIAVNLALHAPVHGSKIRLLLRTALRPQGLSQHDHRHRRERSRGAGRCTIACRALRPARRVRRNHATTAVEPATGQLCGTVLHRGQPAAPATAGPGADAGIPDRRTVGRRAARRRRSRLHQDADAAARSRSRVSGRPA